MRNPIIALVLILLVIWLSSCSPAPSAEQPAEDSSTEQPAEDSSTEQPPTTAEASDCFVPKQILLTGSRSEVEEIAILENLQFEATYSLSYFDQFRESSPVDNPEMLPRFPVDSYSDLDLVTNLYTVADTRFVTEVVSTINQISDTVFPDPNYLIGHRIEGLAWISKGSPSGGNPAVAMEADFWQQWAWGGIGLSNTVNNGEGVLIGVFDSFESPPYDSPYVSLQPPASSDRITDHGHFVTRLIDRMAPESEIYEYRVLNDYGQGTLDVIFPKLREFLEEVATARANSNFKGAVVNLSLGIHPDCLLPQQDDPAIESLEERLTGAYRNRIVIVAAAGNDSKWETPLMPMQIPASWDFVIGVGASNMNGDPACFSNNANIFAPGGEGDGNCEPAVDQCPAEGANCQYGLISAAPSVASDYAYWAGTSFAAPLVSGLAALVLAEEGNMAVPRGNNYIAPDAIYRAVVCDDNWDQHNDRVININETFASCVQQ